MADDTVPVNPVATGVAFASEALFPGGSNLVKGDLKQAGIHAALGYAAAAFVGPIGLILVSANSFTKALTGRNLGEYVGLGGGADQKPKK